jgi:hypothetical protein
LTATQHRWLATLAVLAGLSPFAAVLAREFATSQREWRAAQENVAAQPK